MPAKTFPEGFRWGTATAAHQIEGGNVNNDWWRWEHTPGSGCKESSGDCCDSWHRWPDDVALLKELGFTDYRFSLEWSRIEPADGEFSNVALDHYARLCEGLLEAGVAPVVTFHHFTTPLWLADQGGWSSDAMPDRFAAYCEQVGRAPRRADGPRLHDQRAQHGGDPRPPRGPVPARGPVTATCVIGSTRSSCGPTARASTRSEPTPPGCRSGSRWR